MKLPFFFLLNCLSIAAAAPPGRPELVVVLVIDGLRPDSVTSAVMPNLDRLKNSGVWYTQAHSIFPTVTRVNAATISTGTLPAKHGIVSNALYLPTVSSTILNNGDYRNLLSLGKLNGGRVVGPKSLGEHFEAAGIRYVAISSGSTGNALLLNPTAPYGKGSVINAGFENGTRTAFPDTLNAAILSRFGTVKGDEGDAPFLWTERVLREYVLETLKPQVIVNWMGRSDSAQHQFGVGSPQALAALRLIDQQIGLLLERLRQLKLEDKTDIIVTCDHGFDYEPRADTLAPLRDSNFAPGEIVVDTEGGASLFYVKNHDPEKISRLVERFQASPSTNAIFVPARRPANGRLRCSPGAVKGYAAGTFALEFASQCLPSHGADMIVTYGWETAANPFGAPGTQWTPGTPGQPANNGHGGLNPFVTHSTLLAVGRDFQERKTIEIPAGNQDIAPTLLALQGLRIPGAMDGRVLSEALKNPSKERRQKSSNRRIEVSVDSYCAEVDVSYAGEHVYLNYARRCGVKP
jgi:predicted AlkP superfamily pyrophosphatase or phosphodiesterase